MQAKRAYDEHECDLIDDHENKTNAVAEVSITINGRWYDLCKIHAENLVEQIQEVLEEVK